MSWWECVFYSNWVKCSVTAHFLIWCVFIDLSGWFVPWWKGVIKLTITVVESISPFAFNSTYCVCLWSLLGIHIFYCCVFLLNWTVYFSIISFFISSYSVLFKVCFIWHQDSSVCLLWACFFWYIVFHSFISVCGFLWSKLVVGRIQWGPDFLSNLSFIIGEFNPPTFKDDADRWILWHARLLTGYWFYLFCWWIWCWHVFS